MTTEGLHKREAGGRQGVIKCYNNIALAAQPAGAHFIDLVIKCVALFLYFIDLIIKSITLNSPYYKEQCTFF